MKKILFLFLLIHIKIYSQDKKPILTEEYLSKHKYLEFLLRPDAKSQANFFNFSYQYVYTPKGNSFHTAGFHPTLGFNFARFFSRKFILGVCIDFKTFKGFTTQQFSNDFISNFNSNYISTYSNPVDSAKASLVKSAINDQNNSSGHYIRGNYFYNLGIIFSPFPGKYGSFVFQYKIGNREYPVWGLHGNTILTNSGSKGTDEWEPFEISARTYQISFKPYSFFGNTYSMPIAFRTDEYGKNDGVFIEIFKAFTITLYYEELNLRDATFYSTPIGNFVKQLFMDKYGTIKNYGIKIGFGLY
jgi:hypothetical protein